MTTPDAHSPGIRRAVFPLPRGSGFRLRARFPPSRRIFIHCFDDGIAVLGSVPAGFRARSPLLIWSPAAINNWSLRPSRQFWGWSPASFQRWSLKQGHTCGSFWVATRRFWGPVSLKGSVLGSVPAGSWVWSPSKARFLGRCPPVLGSGLPQGLGTWVGARRFLGPVSLDVPC